MSTATMRTTRGSGGRDEPAGSTVWFWLLLLAAVALLGFLGAWLGGWIRFSTDPRVTEILALQEEARAKYAANGGPANLVEATAAVAAMGQIQQKIEALPKHLRPQVERSGSGMMRQAFGARIDTYFAAPPEKRQAELDRQIDQDEIMRKAFEAGSAIASVVGGGQGNATSRAREGGGGGGAPRGGGGSGNAQDDRNRWRKQMIDRTTPEQRARYAEYRRAMEKRREERGMPSGGPR